jgi:hypothetical protein
MLIFEYTVAKEKKFSDLSNSSQGFTPLLRSVVTMPDGSFSTARIDASSQKRKLLGAEPNKSNVAPVATRLNTALDVTANDKGTLKGLKRSLFEITDTYYRPNDMPGTDRGPLSSRSV